MKKTLPLLALVGLFTLGAPLAQAQAPGAGSAWTETAHGRVIPTGTPQAKAKSAKKKSVAAAKGKAGKKKATKASAAQKGKKKTGAKALTASGKSRKTARSLH